MWCLAIGMTAWLIWGTGAQAEEETLDSKAATEVIESLQATMGNLTEFRNLPPSQRVAWVRDKAAQYVQDKVISGTKDALTKAMDDYARAAFRAKAFETIAAPALKNALVAGMPLDWSQIEARMLSETDTKIRAYGLAVQGISIAWDSVDAFSESGANAGFSKLASGVYQAVAEAYIPGWGWFKLGATMVEGLGNFVMNYATDTATEGMLSDMFGMKTEPQAFCRMLQTTTPDQITNQIEDKWELVAAGRVWQGQGTDAGDQAMKQRLKNTMMDLKTQIAHQVEEQRKKDAELLAKMQPYLDAASKAEAKLKETAGQIAGKARPMLDTIKAFDRKINAAGEAQAQSNATTYAAQAQSGPGDLLPYTPLPRAEVTDAYNLAFDMCKTTLGGSFSGMTFSARVSDAGQVKWRVVHEQTWPPNWAGNPGFQAWSVHQSADRVALDNEIEVLRRRAYQRIGQQEEALRNRVAEWAAEIRAGETTLENGLQAMENEGRANLLQPETLIRYFVAIGAAYCPTNYTEEWLAANLSDFDPVETRYRYLAARLEKLESDRGTFLSLDGKRKALYGDFQTLIAQMDAEMKAIVPTGCQDFTVLTTDRLYVQLRWNVTNYISTMNGEIAATARYVQPKCVDATLNIDTCIAIIKGRLGELQNEYDAAELRQGVQRVAGIVQSKLAPYAIPGGNTYNYAVGIRARVNDSVDYRQPIERTDLFRFAGLLDAAWQEAQPRMALLQKYSASVDPILLAGLLKNGDNLTTLQKVITIDQTERAQAPALAASQMTSYQNILKQWPETPAWRWTLSEYEDGLAGMAGTLSNAQRDLRRAKTASSPIYTLMQSDLETYIQALTTRLNHYQIAYAKDAPAFGKTMPVLTVESGTVTGARNQPLTIAPQVNETGDI